MQIRQAQRAEIMAQNERIKAHSVHEHYKWTGAAVIGIERLHVQEAILTGSCCGCRNQDESMDREQRTQDRHTGTRRSHTTELEVYIRRPNKRSSVGQAGGNKPLAANPASLLILLQAQQHTKRDQLEARTCKGA